MRVTILSALCVLMALTSCSIKRMQRPPEPVYQGTVTVESLKHALIFRDILTLSAEVSAKVSKHGHSEGTANGIMLYDSHGRMRLRLYSPIGTMVLDILNTDYTLRIFVPDRERLYLGKSLAMSALPGLKYSMIGSREGGYTLLAHKERDGQARLEYEYNFEPETLRLLNMASYHDDRKLVSAIFSDYEGLLPHVIDLAFANGYNISMKIEEPETNITLPEGSFAPITLPENETFPYDGLLQQEQTQ